MSKCQEDRGRGSGGCRLIDLQRVVSSDAFMTKEPDTTALTVEEPEAGPIATDSAPGMAASDPGAGASDTSSAPAMTDLEMADLLGALTVEEPAPGAIATDSAPGMAASDPGAGARDTSGVPATTGPETADLLPLGRVQLTPSRESPSPRGAEVPVGQDVTQLSSVAPMAEPHSALRVIRRLLEQLRALPPRVARAVAVVRDAAGRMRAEAAVKKEVKASRGRSHASSSGDNLIPILLSLNIALLAVMVAMLILE
ncbi:MAG: hypothetical protein A2V77_23465 [Anaeromyxobacter sp. RBG_16_69_14]|nr:MAG: hypothetical protein A2V77_23465 [Anaeromyxobacter sp. RBG_16_69_14]